MKQQDRSREPALSSLTEPWLLFFVKRPFSSQNVSLPQYFLPAHQTHYSGHRRSQGTPNRQPGDP